MNSLILIVQQQCSRVEQHQLWDLFLWDRVSAEVSVHSHFSQTSILCECWWSESVQSYNQSLSVIWTYIIQFISALGWVYCCIDMSKIIYYVRYFITVVVSLNYLQMSSHCLKLLNAISDLFIILIAQIILIFVILIVHIWLCYTVEVVTDLSAVTGSSLFSHQNWLWDCAQ